jgi:molecular chaperone IbpA
MTTFDFSPLFRTSVGFDRLASMLNATHRPEQAGGYPPYNIVSRSENSYQITMAVAGFAEDELKITSEMNQLTVVGEKSEDEESESANYLYRGIATRSFERRFNLADHVRVTGARLDNGLLHIDLERELPEVMKPRTIEIRQEKSLLEGKAQSKTESKVKEKAA